MTMYDNAHVTMHDNGVHDNAHTTCNVLLLDHTNEYANTSTAQGSLLDMLHRARTNHGPASLAANHEALTQAHVSVLAGACTGLALRYVSSPQPAHLSNRAGAGGFSSVPV